MRICSAFALVAALVASVPAVAQTWQLQLSQDPFTDQPRILASVLTRDLSIGVRCFDRTLDAIVLSGYVGEESSSIRYRVDQGPVRESVWDTIPGQDGLWAWAPSEFARDLVAGSRLTLEYSDFSGQRHVETVGLRGSAAAINAVLDACAVPRSDPRASNDAIWRRAVQDLDKVPADTVEVVQQALNELEFDVEVSGRRDQQTYLALSRFYAGHWQRCEDVGSGSSSCEAWLQTRRYDADADYPVEPVALLYEVATAQIQADIDALVAADQSPSRAPDWVREPSPVDIGRMHPERAKLLGLGGEATVECDVEAGGRLSTCEVVTEAPEGHGFGRAAIQLAPVYRLRPQTAFQAERVQFSLRWPEPHGD